MGNNTFFVDKNTAIIFKKAINIAWLEQTLGNTHTLN